MTTTPPVPPGNQSPYPIVEPPHEAAADLPPVAAKAEPSTIDRARDLPLVAIGAAIGMGAALIGGAVFAFGRKGTRSRGKSKKR